MSFSRARGQVGRQWLKRAFGAFALTGGIGWGSFSYATRHAVFSPLYDEDALVQSRFHRAFNPHGNQSLSDIYHCRIPTKDLDPELVADFKNGGSKLIERYCQGLYGKWAFAIQRSLVRIMAAKDPRIRCTEDVLSTDGIRNNAYDPGVLIAREFHVLQKSPSSIVLRGGDADASEETGLRKMDVLTEIEISMDEKADEIKFSLKNMFFCGEGAGVPPPLPEFVTPLHLMYAKALAANGAAHCMK